MRLNIVLVSTVIAGAVLATSVRADCGGQHRSSAAPMSADERAALSSDEIFIRGAYLMNQAEVRLGQLALDRSSHPDVQNFARHMVNDHGAVLRRLERIADRNSIPLPRRMDPVHRDIERSLSQLSGAAFDREFMRVMVKDHANAVMDLQEHAANAKSPDVRAFAQELLPSFRDHFQMAQQVAASAGADTQWAAAINAPGDTGAERSFNVRADRNSDIMQR